MAIEQLVQGIQHLQARIGIALIEEQKLILRISHNELIQVAGQVTHHHEVVQAADRGVTLHRNLRHLEVQELDLLVVVVVVVVKALQEEGSNR